MTDRGILDHFNECFTAIEQRRAECEHVAIEIPPGKPQIEYFDKGCQWTPRGDALPALSATAAPTTSRSSTTTIAIFPGWSLGAS